jgi:multimeric flavodoxin WrbA
LRGEIHCPYWDELEPVKTAMKEADVWILASPVYVEDVNGVMKIFLERMAHVNHRPEFAGKYAFLLTTSGAGSSGHAAGTMANTLRTWGVNITGQRDFVCGALSTPDDLIKRYEKKLLGIGGKIVDAYQKKSALSPSFVSLIFFKVQQAIWGKHVEGSIDYHYWKEKRWLNPGVTYYVPHRTNLFIVFFARLTGSVIARFFE